MNAVSASQWEEWQAWFKIRGPFGPAKEDYYWPRLLHQGSAPGTKFEESLPGWLRLNDPARPPTELFLKNWLGGEQPVTNEDEE